MSVGLGLLPPLPIQRGFLRLPLLLSQPSQLSQLLQRPPKTLGLFLSLVLSEIMSQPPMLLRLLVFPAFPMTLLMTVSIMCMCRILKLLRLLLPLTLTSVFFLLHSPVTILWLA
jgi:hypothetical protein